MEYVKLKKQDLQKAYDEGNSDVKATLERLYPGEFKKTGRVKVDEAYYYISPVGRVEYTLETEASFDKKMYEHGNYFHTQEQAEEVLRDFGEIISHDALEIPPHSASLSDFFLAWQRKFGIRD